ncbi:MAG: hypothetical protein V4722_25525 [Bacteroidota bacterium]
MKKLIVLFALLIACQYLVAQNVGIGTITPTEKLHVAGNIKIDTLKSNAIRLSNNAGSGKILTSDDAGNASWQKISNTAPAQMMVPGSGNIGYGVWGDCATNGNISEYQPVADTTSVGGLRFGYSVSTSGNYAIVGAWGDNVGGNVSQGSANIYQYDGVQWVFMQKLTDATGAAGDEFGYSVSISGNSAIVGARKDDVGANADQGSAIIYQYNGTSWVFMQKITDAAGAANDYYGHSVSVSGNFLIVGSPGDDNGANTNQGSVIFYEYYNVINWVPIQKTVYAPVAGSNFGNSVSISGNHAIVGANGFDVATISGSGEGAAIVYQFIGTNWVYTQRITDYAGAANDYFGSSVSISGNYAIVGAPYDDFSGMMDSGSASIFKWNGSNWILMERLNNTTPFDTDLFGFSVAISGNYAMVGCLEDNIEVNNNFNNVQGSTSIYQSVGKGWQRLQYLTDPGGKGGDGFGTSVSVDVVTKRFIVGVQYYANATGKVVFGKIN